jgi:hypothetical protein
MAQIFQGVKNIYQGTTGATEGLSGIAQGTTGILSEGFGFARKGIKLAEKLLGGNTRKSERLAKKTRVQYYSPRRSPSKKLTKDAAQHRY